MTELDAEDLQEFEKYKEKHPEYFPEGTSLKKQHGDFKAILKRREQEKEQKKDTFHKLDQAVETKSKGKAERAERDYIEQEADRILREENPIEFIKKCFFDIHVGDEIIFYGLLASIGSQLCRPSDGIQPGLTGESGKGKSDACRALFYLLPEEYKQSQGFSNKSFFYDQLKPGTVFYFDDAANLKEDIQDMIKQTTSDFQQPYQYRTVYNGNLRKLQIPARLVFWITTVGGNFPMQFLNRQLNLSVDDSTNQDGLVLSATKERYKEGNDRFSDSEKVKICREMIKMLKDRNPVTVKIPFADKIHWNQPKNRRNFPMFLDTVNAFAAFMQHQRDHDGSDAILANREDFNLAKVLWTGISQEQVGKLTKDDLRVLNCIKEKGEKSHMGIYSIPRQAAKRALGFSDTKMHLIIHGKDGIGGLREKVEGFDLIKGSKSVELTGGGTRTVHCDELEYDGSLDVFGQFSDLVWIDE